MAVHSTVVANKLIDFSRESGINLTQMHLQKLTYITHGWSLAFFDKALTSDVVKAYEYGPIYPELGIVLRKYGKDPIREKINCKLGTLTDTSQIDLLKEVHDAYGKFEAWKLSDLTHKDGTPWSQIYSYGAGKYEKIPNKKIKDYFFALAEQAPA